MSKYNKLLIGFIICILCISPIAGANIDWNTFQSNLNHTGYVAVSYTHLTLPTN